MTIISRGRCARCDAELRRARPRGEAWCDPCRRAGPDPRRDLPPGFYFQDSMVTALAEYDFAVVFRRVRAHTGWSQQTLASLVGLDQARISSIERGGARLRDVALVAQVATGLRIPPVLLGFGDPGTTVGQAGVERRKLVSWMERRDFFQHATALAVGVTGAAGLDIDRLTALLPHADPTGDADTAVSVGHQAIDAVTALYSPRAYDRLRVLNTALQPLHTSAGVAELRDRLSTTAA